MSDKRAEFIERIRTVGYWAAECAKCWTIERDQKYTEAKEAALAAYDAAPGVRTAISMGRAIQSVVDRIERATRHAEGMFTTDIRWLRGLAKELAGHWSPPDAAAGREGQPPVAWRYWKGKFNCYDYAEQLEAIRPEDRVSAEPLFTLPAPKSDEPKMVAACCGRPECGGECGNEWRDMEPVPKADAAADWVCVPREPTDAMRRAAQVADMYHSDHEEWLEEEWPDHLRIYQALLAASPARVGEKCRYCDGAGEIETDNNGPIAPCPICRPAAMSREAQ